MEFIIKIYAIEKGIQIIMKKIFVKAYLKKNFGDDLFVKILTDRYNEEFATICNPKFKYWNKTKGIKFNTSFFRYYFIRIYERLKHKKNIIENELINKSDIIINIGGSIFIENFDLKDIEKEYNIYKQQKPYYILGSNFGPYNTEKYKEYVKYNILEKAEDVCLRDIYSYNLFKDLSNVRYASDIVFSLDTSKVKKTNEKKVVISIIDCNKKVNSKCKDNYENKIIEIMNFFDKKGYEVILMSYCKAEGDEDAIQSIMYKTTDNKLKNKINTYFYNGNIEEALNVMGDCQIVVGSRFHANILGLALNKTIIPIAYSDKTINVLKDMNFKGKVFDIRDLESFNVNELTDEDLTYRLDVSFQKKDAQRHFEKLDRVLERKEKNE